jgi:hypothetical protein
VAGRGPDQVTRHAAGWLSRLACSCYTPDGLRADLDRFAFLLAGHDPDTATRLIEGGTDESVDP